MLTINIHVGLNTYLCQLHAHLFFHMLAPLNLHSLKCWGSSLLGSTFSCNYYLLIVSTPAFLYIVSCNHAPSITCRLSLQPWTRYSPKRSHLLAVNWFILNFWLYLEHISSHLRRLLFNLFNASSALNHLTKCWAHHLHCWQAKGY